MRFKYWNALLYSVNSTTHINGYCVFYMIAYIITAVSIWVVSLYSFEQKPLPYNRYVIRPTEMKKKKTIDFLFNISLRVVSLYLVRLEEFSDTELLLFTSEIWQQFMRFHFQYVENEGILLEVSSFFDDFDFFCTHHIYVKCKMIFPKFLTSRQIVFYEFWFYFHLNKIDDFIEFYE